VLIIRERLVGRVPCCTFVVVVGKDVTWFDGVVDNVDCAAYGVGVDAEKCRWIPVAWFVCVLRVRARVILPLYFHANS
jgi:hypothetical protein